MLDQLKAQLLRDEGCELSAYPDPLSPLGKECANRGLHVRDYKKVDNHASLSGEPWTIGAGHTGDVSEGDVITQHQADELLLFDIDKHKKELDHHLPWAHSLDNARYGVLINMCFNMGINGLLKFKNTLKSVELGRYSDAADGMLQSLWARQVGARARRLAIQMCSGMWQ